MSPRALACLDLGEELARTDFYERFPMFLQHEMASLDLAPQDAQDRRLIRLGYDEQRWRDAYTRRERAERKSAQRSARRR